MGPNAGWLAGELKLAHRSLAREAIYWQGDQGVQYIMQFVGIANIGPRLFSDPLDRSRIELSHLFENGFRKNTPHLDCTGAALFERSVVQVCVRVRIKNFVGEL